MSSDDHPTPPGHNPRAREHNGYAHVGIPPGCLACAAERGQPTAEASTANLPKRKD